VRTLLSIIFMLGFAMAPCYAQQGICSGTIVLSDSSNAENANITLVKKDGSIEAVFRSADKGMFMFTFEKSEIKQFTFNYIGYVPVTVLTDTLKPNRQGKIELRILMKEESQDLNEVVIQGESSEPDTVSLDLNKLHLKETDDLGTILKKIPNFRTEVDGSIIYKGKSIDKILVNKRPAFENQNSIALKSLEKKMIEGISVINNYMDDFSLNFDEKEETVLNVDTKEDYKNVVVGSVLGGYGYNKKVDFQGKSMMFSKSMNAFLVSNTNNVGKNIVQQKELLNIFSSRQPYSNYQINALNEFFKADENRIRDFKSFSNLTVRKQGAAYRLNLTAYYFNIDNLNTSKNTFYTGDAVPIQERNTSAANKGESFMVNSVFDSRLSQKSVLNYQLSISAINGNSQIRQTTLRNSDSSMNDILSKKNTAIFSVFNRLGISNKLSDKIILSTEALQYHENTKFPENNIASSSSVSFRIGRDQVFKKNVLEGKSSLKANISAFFMPTFSLGVKRVQEDIDSMPAKPELVLKRTTIDAYSSIGILGNKIFNKIDYSFLVTAKHFENRSGSLERDRFLLPYEFRLAYENRLNNISLSFNEKQTVSALESGLAFNVINGAIVYGSPSMASTISSNRELKAAYAYNNLFNGITYNLTASYMDSEEEIKQGLAGINDNGILIYKLYVIPKETTLKLNLNTSRILMKYSFPIKANLVLEFLDNSSSSFYQNSPVPVRNSQGQATLGLETLNEGIFNMENNSSQSMGWIKTGTAATTLKYFSNTLSGKLSVKKFDMRLAFIYQNNQVYGKRYIRRNFDGNVYYNFNKLTLGLEAKNFDDIFHLFDNGSYNTSLTSENGINAVLIKNSALNYCIIIAKYNFTK
jgi:hypothetical protein